MKYQQGSPNFGHLLRYHRIEQGLTQQQLANLAGLTQRSICLLEGGQRSPRLDTIARLALALQIDAAERHVLLEFVNTVPPTETFQRLLTPAMPFSAQLPAPVTPLRGRETLIAKALTIVQQQTRLLTFTGPGGIGKTRIAIAVARELQESECLDVAFISLADVHAPELVGSTIANAVGASPSECGTALEALVAHIGSARLLLVVDNMEHLWDSALFIAELLAHCPGLTVFTTSRRSLDLSGEYLLHIPPLNVCGQEPGDGLPGEAVMLFLERAHASGNAFEESPENFEAAIRICQMLEGLPLAIELAAAQLSHSTVAELAEQITLHPSCLDGGPRDWNPRMQSLQNLVSWSYDQLSDEQQHLFLLLGRLASEFTFEEIRKVWSAERLAPSKSTRTFDCHCLKSMIDEFVAHHLLDASPSYESICRYHMTNVVRDFANIKAEQASSDLHFSCT